MTASLSYRTDLSSFDRRWTRLLREVREGTDRAARDAREFAHVQVITFLVENVYNTAPGNEYERTERALNEVDVHLDLMGTDGFVLTVESGAPYAAQIEQGNELDFFEQQSARLGGGGADFVPQISLDELALLFDTYADAVGSEFSTRTFFERSGQQYQEPGPHVVPAAIAGAYRFAERLDRVWTRAAQRSN